MAPPVSPPATHDDLHNDGHSSHLQHASTAYWRRTLRLTVILLLLWFGITLGVGLMGPTLDFNFFGWPFGFWATTQGALGAYLLIVWYYAWAMNRIDSAEGDRSND